MMTAAAALVRTWAWFYTAPLAATPRQRRRAEIESELWECAHDPSGRTPGLHVLARAVLGVPDDLLWMAGELPAGVRAPRLSTITKTAAILVVVSGLVATASGTTTDPVRSLTVNVTKSGWAIVSRSSTDLIVTPSFAFTLTNHGDRATGALQVNALFSWRDRRPGSLGTAFSPAIGWRGLASGSTSHPIVLYSQSGWWGRAGRLHEAVEGGPDRTALGPATVRLYAHYGRGWIVLGEYPIPARMIQP